MIWHDGIKSTFYTYKTFAEPSGDISPACRTQCVAESQQVIFAITMETEVNGWIT